ncbi:transposase domain-containing protein [Streptomyces noursei]|uniref:transposase domain-containing protein n=1 Tax=Streptomyces noursei TaxID=1971 RepID=UPI003318C8E8
MALRRARSSRCSNEEIDPELVDEVVKLTGRAEHRRRLLPARTVACPILALCLENHRPLARLPPPAMTPPPSGTAHCTGAVAPSPSPRSPPSPTGR